MEKKFLPLLLINLFLCMTSFYAHGQTQSNQLPTKTEGQPQHQQLTQPQLQNTQQTQSQNQPQQHQLSQPKNQQKKSQLQNMKEAQPHTKETQEEDDGGLLGPVRVGPMIGIGILMGPNVSIESKIYKYIGLSFSYAQYNNLDLFSIYDFRSSINKSDQYSINSLHMSYKQIEGKISIFPWGKTFFIGTAFGKRDITLNADGTLQADIPTLGTVTAPIGLDFSITSTYLTPQIGWLANWDGPYGGFAIGTEFGVQIALSNSVSLSPSIGAPYSAYLSYLETTSQYQDLKDKVEKEAVDKFKQYPLPYWNIIKVGWLF